MNFLTFWNPCKFFNFFAFMEIPVLKKNEVTIVQLFGQSSVKFLCVIWNLVTKTYQKFITLRSFFKVFNNAKKNWKN